MIPITDQVCYDAWGCWAAGIARGRFARIHPPPGMGIGGPGITGLALAARVGYSIRASWPINGPGQGVIVAA
jgi:hypothetical protein